MVLFCWLVRGSGLLSNLLSALQQSHWQAPATLPKDICEAGTFCDIDCAGGYANFDEAKGCANAGKGYCCKDTKPAKYPFTPNTK